MHEAPEKGAGASIGRAISQVAEPTPTACDIAPFIHAALFTAQHAHTHASPLILPLSLSLSLPPSRSLFPTVAAEPAQSSLFLVPRCSRSHWIVWMRGLDAPFRSCEPPVRLLSGECGLILSLSLTFSHPHRASSLSFAAFSPSSIVFRMRFALEKPFQRTSFRITSSRDDSHCRRFLTVRELRAFALGERTQIASICNLFIKARSFAVLVGRMGLIHERKAATLGSEVR